MRSNISIICGLPRQSNSLAVISYGGAQDSGVASPSYSSKAGIAVNGTIATNTTVVAQATIKPNSVAWPFTYTNKCNNVWLPGNFFHLIDAEFS